MPKAGVLWEWRKWVKVVKRYKLPIKRYINSGDIVYSIVTVVTILCCIFEIC